MTRVAVVVVTLFAQAACYRPALEDACSVECSSGLCPGNLVCGDDRMCKTAGQPDCRDRPLDAGADGDVDDDGSMIDASLCFGSGTAPYTRICLTARPDDVRTLPAEIDTDGLCDTTQMHDGVESCVLVAQRFQVVGVSKATGSRPLVILASETIDVMLGSEIDLAGAVADPAVTPGPAGSRVCPKGAATSSLSTQGAGGGSGGSFRFQGGIGGSGEAAQNLGGAPGPTSAIDQFRGGCAGGDGGRSNSPGGKGGHGGGAVYLLAGDRISIEGTINASGSGAKAAGANAGGGGGGSGGMIVLDANVIEVKPAAMIFALAGAGGSGGWNLMVGNPGGDPMSPTQFAMGGPGVGSSGIGGRGGSQGGGSGAAGGGGGGGGGGADGIIWSSKPLAANMNIAPAPF